MRRPEGAKVWAELSAALSEMEIRRQMSEAKMTEVITRDTHRAVELEGEDAELGVDMEQRWGAM